MKLESLLLLATLILLISGSAQADTIFDNGDVSETTQTWIMSAPAYGVVDDFSIALDSVITDIIYEAWHLEYGLAYSYTSYYIWSSMPADIDDTPLTSGSSTADFVENGLTNTVNPSSGYTHTLSGLSIALSPGTYYLGFTMPNLSGIGIGSGPGNASTIGLGLYQWVDTMGPAGFDLKEDDHMSFRLEGNIIPEPTSLLLLGTGLGFMGLAVYRRRKK